MLDWIKKKLGMKTEEIEEEVEELIEEVEDKLEDLGEQEEVLDNLFENLEVKEEELEEELEEVKKVKDEVIKSDKEFFVDKKIELDEVASRIEQEILDEVIENKKILETEVVEVEAKEKVIVETQEELVENLEDIIEEKKEILEDKVLLEQVEEPKKKSFFDKLKEGLTKTRDDFTNKIDDVLKSYQKIDEELFEDLEEVLITADVGMNTTMELIDRLKDRIYREKTKDPEGVKNLLKDEMKKLMLESVESNQLVVEPSPAVILVVGVNGVGKTTTIGKMSNRFKEEGKSVLVAAGDTFRAAAIEQLEEWGNRSHVDVISHTEGSDPAAVIYDGIQAAKARGTDVLICDTAGRLHNKSNLMNELNKIFRVVDKEYPNATKEVLLVLDATTGQNAISQAKVFKEVANITGVVLTKLDGTAKGGVVIALQSELNLPVKLVGVGEGIYDLQPFETEDFVEAIFN